MMELLSKIRLSGRFGKMTYWVSGVLTVTMAALVVYRPVTIPFCIIIKMLSVPVIYYLNRELTKGLGIYFWINLGIGRREYYLVPIVLEFLCFVLLITVSGLTGYAIR